MQEPVQIDIIEHGHDEEDNRMGQEFPNQCRTDGIIRQAHQDLCRIFLQFRTQCVCGGQENE